MPGIKPRIPSSRRHLQRPSLHHGAPAASRLRSCAFSISPALPDAVNGGDKDGRSSVEPRTPAHSSKSDPAPDEVATQSGAMSRRLAEATEEALLEGGRAGRRAVEDAGFSEELKSRLLEKVEAAKFQSENATAFAEVGMRSNVGSGSRDIAAGQAWTGDEDVKDTVLRMLDDARKPLKPHMRASAKIPNPVVDVRPQPKVAPGQRLANARDKSSLYAISKDSQMSEKERADFRQELRDRFTPGARPMPTSIRGLAALANERIEDAIARGQFKNIPRGVGIERDTRADNPFVDTTEYIMNKMIQRQDIVPPWIEKQQELVKAAHVFRVRLRNDWKRHAARTIGSRGGSLQDRIAVAARYAEAEQVHNPRKRPVEQVSIPTNVIDDLGMIQIIHEAPEATTPPAVISETESGMATTSDSESVVQEQPPIMTALLPAPFRLPDWEAAEMSYLQLAITNLNNITRSYNLMAPELAKKPYFSLERELNSCYADVAPQLMEAVRSRATRPAKDLAGKTGSSPGGILENLITDKAVIHDSKRSPYGLKEFWRDLWRDKIAP